jgi:hypothetical protein
MYNSEMDRSDYYLGEIVEECDRLGIRTLEQMNSVLSYDYSELFRKLHKAGIEEIFHTDAYVLFHLILFSHPENFSIDYLVNTYDWLKEYSKEMLKVANSVKLKK